MSKAILVIDMPEGCDNCPLMFRHEEERCCIAEGRNSFSKKPNWCPLKPVSEKALDVLEALYRFKSQEDYFEKMFGTTQNIR